MEKTLEINPYFEGRREWNERYGDKIQAAKSYRTGMLLALAVALVSTGGCIFLATSVKFVPYLVQTNAEGQIVQTVHPVASPLNDRLRQQLVENALSEFIVRMRSVVTDAVVQRDYLERAYANVMDNTAPKNLMDEFFKTPGNNPLERASRETVNVQVESVLAQSDASYQLEWRETTYELRGQQVATQRFRALVSMELRDIDQPILTKNPLGLFITSLSIKPIGG